MITKLLLNTQMIWPLFIKTLKNTIQIKNKILIIFDDIIAEILNNKNLIAYKLYKSHLIFDHSSDIDFK